MAVLPRERGLPRIPSIFRLFSLPPAVPGAALPPRPTLDRGRAPSQSWQVGMPFRLARTAAHPNVCRCPSVEGIPTAARPLSWQAAARFAVDESGAAEEELTAAFGERLNVQANVAVAGAAAHRNIHRASFPVSGEVFSFQTGASCACCRGGPPGKPHAPAAPAELSGRCAPTGRTENDMPFEEYPEQRAAARRRRPLMADRCGAVGARANCPPAESLPRQPRRRSRLPGNERQCAPDAGERDRAVLVLLR